MEKVTQVVQTRKTLFIESKNAFLWNAEGELLGQYRTAELLANDRVLTAEQFDCTELIIKIKAPLAVHGGAGCKLYANVAGSKAYADAEGAYAFADVEEAYAYATRKGAYAFATRRGAYAFATRRGAYAFATRKGAYAFATAEGAVAKENVTVPGALRMIFDTGYHFFLKMCDGFSRAD